MFFGGAADDLDYAHEKDPANAKMMMALVPKGPKDRTTFAWTAITAVSSQTENPDLAVKAMVALTDGIHHWKVLAPRKSLATVEDLCRAWSRWGLTRADQVVAVGGGVVTDTAGFAAAVYHRGVGVVHVPTTLLGMVDAAIGGKTGIDLPAGKNTVGAFHQPLAVVADLDALAGLPPVEVRSGLAEVAKAGLVGDPGLVAALAGAAGPAADGDPEALAPLVEAAVRVKAAVVGADEREAAAVEGPVSRLILNYGHTLGHALERLAGYRGLRHGEAVALGMVFAARVAEAVGLAAPGLAAGHVELLRAVGLPVGGVQLDPDAVLAAMATDKKHHQGPRLVLLRDIGAPAIVPAPERGVLVAAIRSLAEEPA